jgi:hypothetical protein
MREEPRYLDELHARYGDAFRINVERRPWNLLAHPDAIKQVFQAPPSVVRPALAPEDAILYGEIPTKESTPD